jgi:hypothetical protein
MRDQATLDGCFSSGSSPLSSFVGCGAGLVSLPSSLSNKANGSEDVI